MHTPPDFRELLLRLTKEFEQLYARNLALAKENKRLRCRSPLGQADSDLACHRPKIALGPVPQPKKQATPRSIATARHSSQGPDTIDNTVCTAYDIPVELSQGNGFQTAVKLEKGSGSLLCGLPRSIDSKAAVIAESTQSSDYEPPQSKDCKAAVAVLHGESSRYELPPSIDFKSAVTMQSIPSSNYELPLGKDSRARAAAVTRESSQSGPRYCSGEAKTNEPLHHCTTFDEKQFTESLNRHAVRHSMASLVMSLDDGVDEPRSSTSYFNSHAIGRLVKTSLFELVFGALILMNSIVLALQAQYDGFQVGYEQNFRGCSLPAEERWPGAETAFIVLQMVFGIVFICEVAIKILGLRGAFVKSVWNWFDLVIVVTWFLNQHRILMVRNPLALRLLRLFKLLRIVRLAHTFAVFDVLALLVGSIRGSLHVLCWSLVVIVLMLATVAMGMNAILSSYTTTVGNAKRAEVYQYFGTFSRSMLTMWEITFGNWAPVGRLLVDDVSEWYILFFLAWRGIVSFSVVTVIRGVFLHETFKTAQTEEELMIMQKQRMLRETRKQMHAFFTEADSYGAGAISMDRFMNLSNDPRMKAWMAALDMDCSDAEMVFTMMDDGDGRLEVEELLAGFTRLRGPAKSVDMCHLIHMVNRLEERIVSIQQCCPVDVLTGNMARSD